MNKIITGLMAAVMTLAACTKEFQESASIQQETLTEKLVGGSAGGIVPGSLLVKLDENSTRKILEGGFNEISGELLDGVQAISFSPAIPAAPKNAEVARKYGLHQWFNIEFDAQIKPETVAAKVAKSSMVRSVQYNRLIQPIRDGEAQPFVPQPLTRADGDSGFPFDDPFAEHQWNLYNDGSIKGSVAGADVGVKDAWRLTGGDPSVVVAVFDCAVAYRHEDLADAVWKNQAEMDGESGVDDDGNGFIDDKYGFNFVNCFAINSDYVNGKLDGNAQTAIKGQPLNSNKGTGHGTHVAGIIGATNGNGKGVSSIAGGTGNGDGVRLMTCQIYEGSSYCVDAQAAAAFIYAADNGACIAQCSYGNYNIITSDFDYINGTDKIDGSPLENAALRYFLDPANSNHESLEGNIAVFASGNHSNPYSAYPGALPYVLSVTAFGNNYLPGGYTNYGPGCKIAAPGGEYGNIKGDYSGMILSTGVSAAASPSPGVVTEKGENRNYVYMQGTSMACPHVSGVVALGISYAKKLGKKFTREEMTSLLLSSVDDLDSFNKGGTREFIKSNVDGTKETVQIDMNIYKGQMGTGSVDAWKFLMSIEGTPSVMTQVGEKARIDLSEYCNPSLKYEISVDEASSTSLGLTSEPVIKDGFLEIECSKIGAGKIVLSSAVGKDPEREDGIGEMAYTREISIVSRPYVAKNGGWL
ncbi:MAG: S8 family serine peptidase [Bacteroidales bacterium]|nr:S8 family serine peptidase [Bacteroidales bacterium]